MCSFSALKELNVSFMSWSHPVPNPLNQSPHPAVQSCATARLALSLALAGIPGVLAAVIAVVCSSWSPVNQHTSGRDFLLPGGLFFRKSVAAANKMVARTPIAGCLYQGKFVLFAHRPIKLWPYFWVKCSLNPAGYAFWSFY